MATRRDALIGGLTWAAATACGTTGGTTADTGGADTGGEPTCTDRSTANQVVLCFAEHPALENVDGSASVSSQAGGLVVVRTTETEAVALSNVCTHAGCAVRWQAAQGNLFCPCHGSRFALDGSVLVGPATRRLVTFDAAVDADGITITL